MIKTYEITVKSIEDFEKIKKYVDRKYFDNETIIELKKELFEKVDKIVIESNYIDADYLSEYKMLYSGIFKSVSRSTYRLLFYKESIFVGYITLVPVSSKGHICRMFFDPSRLLTVKAHVLTKEYSLHFLGDKILFNSFRAIRQEGCVCVCGHSAVYGVNNYASMWRGYTEKTAAEISDATLFYDKQRIITPELKSSDVMRLLHSFGFNPMFRKCGLNVYKGDLISETIGYVQSGIPVILVTEKLDHGIVAVGYEDFKRFNLSDFLLNLHYAPIAYDKSSIEVKTTAIKSESLGKINIIDANELVENIIVNDDNAFPFGSLPKTRKEGTDFDESFSQSNIDAIIIPLYPKLNLDYSKAKLISTKYIGDRSDLIPEAEKKKYAGKSLIITRTYLTSGNKFKSYIKTFGNRNVYPRLVDLNLLELPKFVWVTEYSTPKFFNEGKFTGLIVIDSTQTINSDEAYIFSIGQDFIEVLGSLLPDSLKDCQETKDSTKSNVYYMIKNSNLERNFTLPRFDKNLTTIN